MLSVYVELPSRPQSMLINPRNRKTGRIRIVRRMDVSGPGLVRLPAVEGFCAVDVTARSPNSSARSVMTSFIVLLVFFSGFFADERRLLIKEKFLHRLSILGVVQMPASTFCGEAISRKFHEITELTFCSE